jgi:uncharacterized protein HemX
VREPETQQALATIRQLSADSIVIQLPDISESLVLASKYKLTLERSSVQGEADMTPERKSGNRAVKPNVRKTGTQKPGGPAKPAGQAQ